MNTAKEYIMCSAIWFGDGQVHEHQPKNMENGFVVTGRRHHNCIMTAAILSGDQHKTFRSYPNIQGFLTSRDRFLDRTQACEFAIKTGQIKKSEVSGKLYSEDLW